MVFKILKRFLIIFTLLFASLSSAQIKISGKIVNTKGEALENAAIYVNNTTFGTFANSEGVYELTLPKGKHVLIVSFLGYETQQYQIDTSKKTVTLYVVLKSKENVLDEIVIKKVVYDQNWYHNLARFKQAFIGTTKFSKNCILLNPKTLSFNFDAKTNTLTVFARKPLRFKNKDLGYLITYDLVDFTLQKNKLTYVGYSKYENLKKRIKKRWIKNRLRAFKGSKMHFMRSLKAKKLKEEGYLVHQFKRVLNKKRPTDEQIKAARRFIILSGGKFHLSTISSPKTALDSANVVLQKSKLPKYRDYLYKKNVSYAAMITQKDKKTFLNFDNYLSIIYTKEAEELNYVKQNFREKRTPLNVQTSAITLLEKPAVLDISGVVIPPLAIFSEGYWAYESFADLLPLNYYPSKGD